MTSADLAGAVRLPTWRLTRWASVLLWVAASSVLTLRLGWMVASAMRGDLAPATTVGFTAIFPGILFTALASLPGPQTREALLMRLGVLLQLILIVALPRYALHLLLGLPVVFLVVELFETRTPRALREAVAGRLARC